MFFLLLYLIFFEIFKSKIFNQEHSKSDITDKLNNQHEHDENYLNC